MSNLLPPTQLQRVMHCRKLLSIYHDNRDLINIGAYQGGTNPELDSAIEKLPVINQFLQQDMSESVTFADSMGFLFSITDDT
jgi:flagellum-specific ATP synthase